ncbi:hypothetical protein JTB14_016044 [Gonioctena quinquepunctata]|nr:hypothetical protein JTB14_016044 [Gonioctena quinquepunctata]
MAERIIPIEIENDNENEPQLSEPMEQLAIEQKQPAAPIQVKTMQKNKDFEKCIGDFDQFEERSKSTLLNANVPEKIILIIDRAQDDKCTQFITEKSKFTPLSMLRRAVHLFLKLKHMINKNHEFALVVLNENNASWLLDFTTDLRKLNSIIDRITQCHVEDAFNLNSLFTVISEHVELPEGVAPRYIIRPIILYGRSYTVPNLEADANIENMLNNPYFIVDVLLTHEPVDKSNNCNKIFEALQNIDKKGLSYFFPVCRDSRMLHRSMSKLLAHPLQRPIQNIHKT